ncbi:MAG TPA: InlB B-repeat-containing protein [Galbitalea sp.]|jgi:uncharacterized repeat protein (TIGR02543 family)|nr:InlB B-repeat-containing protein [Galbitalea sp.]
MKLSIGKKSVVLAAVASAIGISSPLLMAAPADAVTPPCGPDGTLISGNICQEEFTTDGPATFTPNAQMTTLQVLLVGGGGTGTSGVTDYAQGGGGGEVKVVDFSGDTSTVLNLVVGSPDTPSSAQEGVDPINTAEDGSNAGYQVAGSSGNNNAGWANAATDGYGAGGGAGASPTNAFTGGTGVVVSTIAPIGSLFSTDSDCFGGGGAVTDGSSIGASTCGGGGVAGTPLAAVAPTPNTGGGGAGVLETSGPIIDNDGADGLVVVRWNEPKVTLTLNTGGHGANTTETVFLGDTPTKPADPTVSGFVFGGWFTDPSFTTPADFSAPLEASTSFFAKFTPVLAVTGDTLNPYAFPLGAVGLSVGVALIALRRRRAARAS